MKITLTVVAGPHQGKSFEFSEHDNFIVGRGAQAHFRLPKDDPFFSRLHFLVEVNPPLCRLLDMHSANGTFVNKAQVTETNLNDGDLIQGGKTWIRVQLDSQSDSVPESVVFDTWAPTEPQPPVAVPGRQQEIPIAVFDSEIVDKPLEKKVVPLALAPAKQPSRESLPPDYRERIQKTPQPFPGYQIVREVGRGGMGIVYQAICEADESVVALKTIKPAVAGSEKDVERFLREARLLKSLQHPNIVSFREMGKSEEVLYFAMDFVDGKDLKRLLADLPEPLPVPRAVALIRQLLDALDYAHKQGVVHRDIKPANLLVSSNGQRESLSVTDFGLARTYQSSRMSGLTTTGQIGGTTPFIAPEQILLFRDVKPAADQYAVAATLYHLLTKSYVYDFPKTVSAQLVMVLQSSPIPIQQRRSDLPASLVDVIHKGLSREPADRFKDLMEFRQALAGF